MERNIALYVGIAVVIVAVALVGTLIAVTPHYNVTVRMLTNSTPPVYPYETAHIAIVLINKGSAISNMPVGFYVNGAQQNYYKASVPAGKTVAILANYSFTNNGTYMFSAVADPAHIMQIGNRSATSASLAVNVTASEPANIYTSIPNNNINYTQSFSFANLGLVSSSAIADRYNISMFNTLFAIPQKIMATVAEDVSKGTAYANGAYASYDNGTAAYTIWLQGFAMPQDVQYVVSTFQIPSTQFSATVGPVGFMRISNTTSMCTFYEKGWTKVVSYFNDSMPGTCAGMVATSYNSTESNVLIGALKATTNMSAYKGRFSYTNSTEVGTYISYSNRSTILSNMFYNGFGFFTAIIKPTPKTNSTEPPICRGLIYSNGTTNVCSVYTLPRDGTAGNGYALINTTQIGSMYTLQLLSLVNQTQAIGAHANGIELIRALNISQNSTKWSYAFKNYCQVSNSSVGCNLTDYDYSSDNVSLNITNNLPMPLTINHMACYAPGELHNTTINTTLNSGATASFKLPCVNIPIPVVSAATSYLLLINYTYNGNTRGMGGYVNVTNPGFTG